VRRTLVIAASSVVAIVALVLLWHAPPAARRAPGSSTDEDANFGDSIVLGARPPPPLPELRFEGGAPSIAFFALGDTGYGGELLRSNANAMEAEAEVRPVDFVLLLGDNFYLEGVRSLEDPMWRERFEDAFPGSRLQVPFHVVLGNHDHRGEPDIQIAYTKTNARWHMPAHWYTFSVPIGGSDEAQFFALDTQPMKVAAGDAGEQQTWLAAELARSKARWKIVFGHHPVLSHGSHGPTIGVAGVLAPLFERHGVDLYLSGHDHDLQVIRSKAGWIQLVSGASSSTRDTRWSDDTLFAAASPGYAWVGLTRSEMWIEIDTAADGPRFRYGVTKP
jgi:tartrate-resistant acid phosphatase type 5